MRQPACILIAFLLFVTAGGAALAEAAPENSAAVVEEAAEESAEPLFSYRFAAAEEAGEMLLANRAYYENLNQQDLDFRMQKAGATLEELEAMIPGEMRDFTEEEKAAVDEAVRIIGAICRECGYHLPETEGIVFVKTTMAEEPGAGAYTHGTEIYLGEMVLDMGLSDLDADVWLFREFIAHELFHCLTRTHPDFRTAMYGILGFKVAEEDFEFGPDVRERIISNPDVEHHNAYAAFDIGGEMRNCAVVFTVKEPFRQPGDMFLDDNMTAGLVPLDDLNVMYSQDEAANFRDVFGRNTDYAVDPEETLADNFRFTICYGPEGMEYESPWIISAMEEYLRGN